MILHMKPPPGETPREPLSPEEEWLIEYLAFALKWAIIGVAVAAFVDVVMYLRETW